MAQKKRQRLMERRTALADRIIASALTASTILTPLSAAATELTVHDKYCGVTNVTGSNGKYTVTTSKKSTDGKSAFNRFSKFSLDQGHIANMVLPDGTSKLYNFVDGPDKINIQGTVNALKAEAKKIGGHLLFISPKGMIIGEEGAINAGKFSAIIADDSMYKQIVDNDSPWALTEFKRMEAGYVALNKDGSIVVKGRITAPDGVTLKAAQVKTEAGSKIDTKTLNFSSFVNVSDISDSGIDVNEDSLKLERNESGDVRLESIAVGGKESVIEHAGRIEAAGAVALRARASAAAEYSAEQDEATDQETDEKKKVSPFSGEVTYNASADARVTAKSGSTVSADRDVIVSADAWNYRESSFFGEKFSNIGKELFSDTSGLEFDGSYTNLESVADVSIESGAKIEAGQDLKLHAGSFIGATAGTSLGMVELVKWDWANKVPALGVIVSKQKGLASVTVSGDLSAGRDMAIDAKSKLSTELNANAQVYNFDQESPFTVALLWGDLDNNTAVTIAKAATVSASGNISIASDTTSSITTSATTFTMAKAPGATALNATFVTTGAETNINSGLTAGGSISITAADETTDWNVQAFNRTATEMLFAEEIMYNLKQPVLKAVYGKLADKIKLPENLRYGNGAGEDRYDGSKWGFAVVYTGKDFFNDSAPTQKAAVTIAPGVKLVASKDVTITSRALVSDWSWVTKSAVGGSNFASKDISSSYSFAINYDQAEMQSSADIGENVLILSGGSIDIESSARVEWNRVSRIIDKLKLDWETLKSYATGEETKKTWEKANSYLYDDIYHDADLSNWQGAKNYAKGIAMFIGGAFEYLGTVSSAFSFIPDAMQFLDLSSYANVFAQSIALTNNPADKSVSGGGAFIWPNWNVHNAVDIARDAHISASGNVSVHGTAREDAAVIGGYNKNIIGGVFATSSGSGAGGVILVNEFTSQNDVNIHKGALLESTNGALRLATTDSSMQLMSNISAAKSGPWGFQGQVNVLGASFSGRVRADNEATLSAASIDIVSEAENYATNSALTLQTADDKAFGLALAIDSLTYENVARVADFDTVFGDDTAPVNGAYIAADALNVGAFGHAHVNTIAAAGAAAWTKEPDDPNAIPQEHWYDVILGLGDTIKGISKKIGNWGGQKISEIGNAANNGANQVNNEIELDDLNDDDGNGLDDINNGGGQAAELNLAAAGSVAWNFADYTAHAGLEGKESSPLTIKSFANDKNRSVTVSAQADKWQAAFSGAAALALADYNNEDISTVGVGGTLSVNSGSSIVSADLGHTVINALNSTSADKDLVSVSAGSTGRSVVGALGLAVTGGSDESGATVGANVSVNTLNNVVRSTVWDVSTAAAGTGKSVSTDLEVLSYAKDTQVTGALDLAVGKAQKAVGAGIQIAVIKNDIASAIESSRMDTLGAVSVDSYLGSTQVIAGISVAAGIGTSESAWSYSGALVVDTLTNTAAAKVISSDLTASGTVHISAGDGADIGARISQHEASASFDHEVSRVGASLDKIISADSYYKGAEMETEDHYKKFTTGSASDDKTTTVDATLTGRTGMKVITGALTGSGTSQGNGAGTAVVVNNLRNTMDVQVEGSVLRAKALDANSENGAVLVSVAAGASVGGKGWAADGSVIWNSIINTAHTTLKDSNITITGTSGSMLTAQNRALSVGVAGAVGVAFDGLAAGVSLAYSHVTNDAILTVSGGSRSTLAGGNGSLTANAENNANSWLVALAVPFSKQGGAGGGTAALHRITGETSSVFDGLTVSGFKDIGITAVETSSAKTLSGAVSVSAQNAGVSGAVAVTQVGVIKSKDQAQTLHAVLRNSTVNMPDRDSTLNVATSDDGKIFSLALGGGYGEYLSASGAFSMNLLHRRDLSEITGSSVTGTKTAVTVTGTKQSSLTNIGVEINASSTGAGGGAIVVNRIGDSNLVSVTGTSQNKLDVRSLYSLALSDTRLYNVEFGFAGASTGAGQGMVYVNSVSPTTGLTIKGVSVTAAESLAAIALSDSEVRTYAGQGAGAGTGAGAGLISVNYLNDVTYTQVENASLTVNGTGEVSVSHDIDDGDVDNTQISYYADYSVNSGDKMPSSHEIYNNAFQGIFDSKTLSTRRRADTLKGLVIDASSTHVLTDVALVGAGAGTGAAAGSINVDILAGSTKALTIDSDLASSGDISVHASDFSNVDGVFIDGAGAGTGAAAGIVGVRHSKRTVAAEMTVSDDATFALNSVGTAATGAVSKQSLTAFSIAGAGAGLGAGVALVTVDIQKADTTAAVKGAVGRVGGLRTAADHFSRIGSIEVGGSGAGYGAGVVLASVGVDMSETSASVSGVSLDVTGNGDAAVNARNRVNGYNVYVTAAGGIGSGTIGVGVDYSRARVSTALKDSTIGSASQRAGLVSIDSSNTADLLTVAVTASGGLGSGSILVNVDNMYSNVGVDVSNSVIYANDITVSADEDYKLRAHAWGASGGVGAGLIYVQAINFGDAGTISDSDNQNQLSAVENAKKSALDKIQDYVDGKTGVVSSSVLTNSEAEAARAARRGNPVISDTADSTLHVTIDAASLLDAKNGISISGLEKTDIVSYQGGVTGGLGAGAVNLSFLSVGKQSGIVVDQSKLDAGGTISISSELTGTNNQHIVQGTGGAGALFTAYGRAKSKGNSTVVVLSSDISGTGGVSVSALDTAVTETYGAGGSVAIGAVGGIIARAVTDDTVAVTIDGGALKSGGEVSLTAKRAGEIYAQDVYGYIGVASGIGADARASETTNVSVTAGSDDMTVINAEKLSVHSELAPVVHSRVYQDGGNVTTSVGVPLSKSSLNGGSTVTLGAKNSYSVPEISVESFVGSADRGVQVNAHVNSYGGTILGFEYQYSRAEVTNDTTAAIDLRGGIFDAENLTALKLHALNNSDISADMETIRVGGLTIGSANNAAKVFNYGKSTVTMAGTGDQTLDSVDAKAESISDTRAKSNGDGGGAVYIDDASSSSGGAKAAWSRSDIRNTASVDVSGSWKTSGDFSAIARQTAKTVDWTDAVIGGAIAANGTQHDLLLTGQADVSVAKNASLASGGTMTLEASNTLRDNLDNDYTSSGNTYGAVVGNGTKNFSEITQNASVTVGDNSSLTAGSAAALLAHADTDMNEYARIVSGGAAAGSDAVNDFTSTWNNSVTVGSGARLLTIGIESDVTLAAWDNTKLQLTALGDMQGGAVGGATSKLSATINRNNAVSVAGRITAGRDANLWAGLDSAGDENRMELKLVSHAYAHGAIVGASAKLNRTINQKNTVTIGSSGEVLSTRHSNLAGKTGNITLIESAQRYAWYSSKKTGDVASTALGDSISGLHENNLVRVDGSVTAGTNNKFIMNISSGLALLEDIGSGDYSMIPYAEDGKLYVKAVEGTVDVDYVTSDDSGVNEYTKSQDVVYRYTRGTSTDYDLVFDTRAAVTNPEIAVGSGKGSWRLGQVENYATYLYDRMAAIDALLEDYTGDRASAAYQAFVAEKQVIEATLASYGLPPDRDGSSGRSTPLIVPYIEIDPVTVSGGNITVSTSSLTGSGSLTANGAPVISITNGSNLSVKLKGLNILSTGGEVIVNTYSVKDTEDLNSRVSAAKSFAGTVSADAKSDKVPAISVRNTWSTPFVDVTVSGDLASADGLEQGTTKFTVVSDIENTGNIRNYPGTVELSTAIGSIRSVSADIVAGQGIKLSAPRGSVSIKSEGILNVGGAPEAVYENIIKHYAAGGTEEAHTNDPIAKCDAYWEYLLQLLMENGEGAMNLGSENHIAAGGGVFITAGTINVNGTIQSGFGTYDLSLPASLSDKIADFNEQWSEAGSQALADDPAALSAFVLSEEGITWDAGEQAYVRNPAAWYNPYTKKIIVDDMVGAGGTVYLTGRVINTNYWDTISAKDEEEYKVYDLERQGYNLPSSAELKANRGQIIAYAGAAEVKIESALETTIRLGEIDTGERVGRIVINDVRNVTENGVSKKVSRDGVSGDVYETRVVTHEYSTENGVTSGLYTPQTGVSYTVSAGSKNLNTTKDSRWQYFNWWRDSWKGNENKYDGISIHIVNQGEPALLNSGATVALLKDILVSRGSGDIYVGNESVSMIPGWIFKDTHLTSEETSDWNEDVHYNNWTHYSGKITRSRIETTGTQTTSLFALKADNPITVSIKTASNAGQITITAPSADVELTGGVKTSVAKKGVDITAKNVIAKEKAMITADNVGLNAVGSIASGEQPLQIIPIGDVVKITANAGNSMTLEVKGGSAQVDLGVAEEVGTISMTAEGSVLGKAQAPEIILTSQNGGIGTAEKAFEITGSGRTELKSQSAGDTRIVKEDGDLAVNRVEARGDVTLETKNGSIVDAYPTNTDEELSDDELKSLWRNAGLISDDLVGNNISQSNRKKNIDNLENVLRSKYHTYQSVVAKLASADEQVADGRMTQAQREYLEGQRDNLSEFSGVTDIDSYIESQKTTTGTELYKLVNADLVGWTQDYLLYAVQDAILNPSPGSVKSTARESIVGRNVKLLSSVNIGSQEAEKTIQGGENMDMDGLKALSAVSPADVTWNEDSETFTIRDANEVGLTAEETTAKAEGMILIASPLGDLVINSVESTSGGTVHLMADGNVVVSENSTAEAAVKGGNMFIAAAGMNVDIGSSDRPMTVMQTGGSELRASAGRSVYLTAVSNDISLGSVAAREVLRVETAEEGKSILMSSGQGRLNASDVTLITNNGDIGAADSPIRIQNAESGDLSRSVTVSSADDVYLSGENGMLDNGQLNVKGFSARNAEITSEGSLHLSGDMIVAGGAILTAEKDVSSQGSLSGGEFIITAENGAVSFSKEVSADDLIITAKDPIELSVPVTVTDLVSLTSSGAVTVTGTLSADVLKAVSSGDTKLAGSVSVGTLEASASGESSDIVLDKEVSVSGKMTLDASRDVKVSGSVSADTVTTRSDRNTEFGGVVTVRLLDSQAAGVISADSDLTVSGTASLTASGDVSLLCTLTGGSITVTSETGAAEFSKTVSADNLSVRAHDTVDVSAAVTVSGTTELVSTSGDVKIGENILTSILSADAYGRITANGDLTAAAAALSASDDVTLGGAVSADTLTVKSGSEITTAAIRSASAELTASADVTAAGALSGGDYAVKSEQGSVTLDDAEVTTLTASAGKAITADSVTASDNAELTASTDISVTDNLTGGNLELTAGGNVTVKGTTSGDTVTVGSGSAATLADVKAETLTVNAGGAVGTAAVTAAAAALSASDDVTLGGAVSADTLTVKSGSEITTAAISSASADLTASADVTAVGALSGGDYAVASEQGSVSLDGGADVRKLRATAEEDVIQGEAVKTDSITVTAGNSVMLDNPSNRMNNLDLSAGGLAVVRDAGNLSVDGTNVSNLDAETIGTLDVSFYQPAKNVSLTSTNGAVNIKSDLNAENLNVSALESIAPQNSIRVTGDTSLVSSSDITLENEITTGTLTSRSDGRTVLTGSVVTRDLDAGGSGDVLMGDIVRAEGDIVLTSHGGSVTISADINAKNLSVSARNSLRPVKDITVAHNTNFSSSGDIELSGALKTEDLTADAGGAAYISGDVSVADTLIITAVKDVGFGRNVEASRDITLTSRSGAVIIERDVTAESLSITAKDAIIPLHDITVKGHTELTSSNDIVIGNSMTTESLTATAGGGVLLGGAASVTDTLSLTAQTAGVTLLGTVDVEQLDISAGTDVLTPGGAVRADRASVSAGGNVSLENAQNDFGTLAVRSGGRSVVNDANDLTLTAQTDGSLTVHTEDMLDTTDSRSGKDMYLTAGQISGHTLSAGGTITASAADSLSLDGDANADEDLYLTAHEMSVRNLSAGGFLTALSETAFSGNDLTAGEDVRVHTYDDMTFNDATAGGNAWILGLGSSAARMKFHEVKADGLDTAVLLQNGYLDYWRVTAGLDGAAATREFAGPKLAGVLEQGSKIRVYFPYGGSLMPRDPFRFHVRDLLQNIDVDPYDREVLRIWPPRDRKVPQPNLRAGSDDITVDLGDYDYWLPEEVPQDDTKDPELSVSRK